MRGVRIDQADGQQQHDGPADANPRFADDDLPERSTTVQDHTERAYTNSYSWDIVVLYEHRS